MRAWLVALLALAGGAVPARAQFAEAPSTIELPADQTVNLFARWDGAPAIDGLFIELPAGWRLEDAVALRYGTERVPVEVRPSRRGGGEYFVGADRTLRSAYAFVFRVRTGASAGPAVWTLQPFTYRKEKQMRRLTRFRTRRRVELERSAEVEGNRVLSFQQPQAQPLLLRRAALPALSTQDAYTVEVWIKTTGLDEVVLSTWNGLEEQPYPLELVIDPAGRLRYYRGRPGRHESMTSARPVADGTWHHLTVTHDPQATRTRLFVDGAPVDSLRDAASLEAGLDAVALGGRLAPPSQDAEAYQSNPFMGQLDEVQFRPEARTARDVRGTMRQPRSAVEDGSAVTSALEGDGPRAVLLSFEDDWPDGLLLGEAEGLQRVRSDLLFYAPISELSAQAGEEAVALSWNAPGRGTFIVERSTDGTRFRPVGRRQARGGQQRYAFTDEAPTGEVVFYQVRQRFADGTERVSSALKVGRGTEEKTGPKLLGNFPNPFTESTTIAYQMEEEAPVRLGVWDVTGQRVASLVDEQQGPGYHEMTYQPGDLASGTYLIRLRVGGEQRTHKMVLVK